MMRMQTIGRVLALIAVAALGAIVEMPTANAGEMLFRGRGFEDPPSAAAARTEKTGTNHKYVQVDFPGTGTQLCSTVHFTPFSDYAPAGQMNVVLGYTFSGTNANSSRWRVNVGCVGGPLTSTATCTGNGTPRACCTGSGTGNCENYGTITLSPGTGFLITPGASSAANIPQSSSQTTVIDETGCSSSTPVIMQLCRDPADANDTNTDTISVTDMKVSW